MTTRGINRRVFIQRSAAGMLGMGMIGNQSGSQAQNSFAYPRIKDYRRLGRTVAFVSDLGSRELLTDTHRLLS